MAEKKIAPATKNADAKPAVVATASGAAAKPAPMSAGAAKPAVAPVAAKPSAKATPAERQRLIAEAAYYLAERRGFAPGHAVQDWLTAEKNVDAMLARR